jgi:hypothetical protein
MADTKQFQSLSGTDIHAVFNDTIFGELQMLSYKIDREKAPVYTMGSADPRSIARGKRLITGSCVFVTFDRDALLSTMNGQAENQPHLNKVELANMAVNRSDLANSGGVAGGSFGQSGTGGLDTKFTKQNDAQLADQLLPFNITLVGSSEYGVTSKMTLFGIELMSEAGGVSIDDLVLEQQMSFIAKGIRKWTADESNAVADGTGFTV